MNMRLIKSVSMLLLVAGCAISLFAQNYGKPYQPFRPYKGGMAEVEFATMPTAQMSGNIGATSDYMMTTSLPQEDIYEPFTTSTPSGAGPHRAPGAGGTGKTDTENPALLPIGDGIGFLLMMGLLYMILKYVLKHVKSSTLLTKYHQMIK